MAFPQPQWEGVPVGSLVSGFKPPGKVLRVVEENEAGGAAEMAKVARLAPKACNFFGKWPNARF